jgi:glycosyltransferase involved in cell wall biosynthesis
MSPAPSVSVIVPTYNRASFLPISLGSVLSQTYRNTEIVVVDDGSTDGTRQVVLDLLGAQPLPYLYLHQENRGDPAARNRGLTAAQGMYIAFLDSDDSWFPHHLEATVGVLDTNPDVAAVYTDHGITRDGQHMVPTVGGPAASRQQLVRRLLLRDLVLASDALVVRRSVYSCLGGFDEGLASSADWEMWVRIASRARMVYLPTLSVIVYQHAANYSARPERMEAAATRALDAIRSYLPEEVSPLHRQIAARRTLDTAHLHALCSHRLEATLLGLRALLLEPRLISSRLFAATVVRVTLGRPTFERLQRFRNRRRTLPVPRLEGPPNRSQAG